MRKNALWGGMTLGVLGMSLVIGGCSASKTETTAAATTAAETTVAETTAAETTAAETTVAETTAAETVAAEKPGDTGLDRKLTQTEKVGVCTDTDKAGYQDFAEFMEISEPFAICPGYNEGMVAQGMDQCEKTGNIYVSGYFKMLQDSPYAENAGGNPSVIVMLNEAGEFQAEYVMWNEDGTPFESHMGGVAVSDDTLYFSAGQETSDSERTYWIGAVALDSLETSGRSNVIVKDLIQVPIQPSSMNYSDDTLYIGNFYIPEHQTYTAPGRIGEIKSEETGESYGGYVVSYHMGEDGIKRLEAADGHPFAMPDEMYATVLKTQGITMLEDGQMVISQSYGRKNNSAILVFDTNAAKSQKLLLDGVEYDCKLLEKETCLTQEYTTIPMTEGITVMNTESGRDVLILLESASVVYDKVYNGNYNPGIYRTDYIWKIAIPE